MRPTRLGGGRFPRRGRSLRLLRRGGGVLQEGLHGLGRGLDRSTGAEGQRIAAHHHLGSGLQASNHPHALPLSTGRDVLPKELVVLNHPHEGVLRVLIDRRFGHHHLVLQLAEIDDQLENYSALSLEAKTVTYLTYNL